MMILFLVNKQFLLVKKIVGNNIKFVVLLKQAGSSDSFSYFSLNVNKDFVPDMNEDNDFKAEPNRKNTVFCI